MADLLPAENPVPEDDHDYTTPLAYADEWEDGGDVDDLEVE